MLRQHHGRLLEILHKSEDTTLRSLCTNLYSKGIIDVAVKNDILSKGGQQGAIVLLDHVQSKVESESGHMEAVLKIMEHENSLRTIVKEMRTLSM